MLQDLARLFRPARTPSRKKKLRARPSRGVPTKIWISGQHHDVKLILDPTRRESCCLEDGGVHITLAHENPAHPLLADELHTVLKLWFKKRARQIFPERVDFWAQRMNLTPRRVFVTAPLRQWGSCTAQNDIRLNWRLLLLPPEILDYVVVHELAHIPHKHHQPPFWACVASVMPDYLARRQTLRQWERTEDILSFLAFP